MLSILLYGRNDNHGYNYAKRLALCLNCLAEMLNEGEILFTDYNTPDDLPTAPEAISDTLTEKAKALLRIFRVRSKFHPKKGLPLIEPAARNAAIRRMNEKNRWVLSTNTDMLFTENLAEIASKLPDGFYQLPRFELPEALWEAAFDRMKPQETLSWIKEKSKELHLHAIARRPGFLQFDSPGDFQLALRDDLFRIGGFDEEMIDGWHVDANLSKRLFLLGRTAVSLEDRLSAFHCNHTKKESLLHTEGRPPNNWRRFVRDVKTPYLDNPNWGLKNELIEEISLQKPKLSPIFFPEKCYEFTIDSRLYNPLFYSTERLWLYLFDHLVHLAPGTSIAYFGFNDKLRSLLKEKHPIHRRLDADLFLFDFGFDSEIPYKEGRKKLRSLIKPFLQAVKANPTAKFIGINAPRSDFALLFEQYLSVKKTTYITGLIYGTPQKKPLRIKYLLMRLLYSHTDAIVRLFSRLLFK